MFPALIAGLGNPGLEYQESRHNVGFQIIDTLVNELSIGGTWKEDKTLKVIHTKEAYRDGVLRFAKPQDYMNNSGAVLYRYCEYFKIPTERMLVIYDDITLELGEIKISIGGGAGGHNGVEDIMSHLKNDFVRYRVGIGGKPHKEMDLKDHVLGRFTDEEKSVLTSEMPKFINDLKFLLEKGTREAMNFVNQRRKTIIDENRTEQA